MANTSISLGTHWEQFIKSQIATGRYGSASEVIRDALRQMEQQEDTLRSLRRHLAEGEAEISGGKGIKNFSMQDVIRELDNNA